MQTTEQLSEQVLTLTQALIDSSNNGDLEAFNKALSERNSALRLIEETQAPSGNLEALSANLVKTKELNALLEKDFAKQQKRLLDEKSALNKGVKMRQAYSDVDK